MVNSKQVVIKRDTEENWKKAVNYIPLSSVIIIVDKLDGSVELKIGDGQTLVNDLPNILTNFNTHDALGVQKLTPSVSYDGTLEFN